MRNEGGGFAANIYGAMPELRFFLLPLEGGAPKGRRLVGDSGISVSQPSPHGEGAPKGRIGD